MIDGFSEDLDRLFRKPKPQTFRKKFKIFINEYGLYALLAYRLGRRLIAMRKVWYAWPALPFGWALYFLISRYIRLVYGIRLELSAIIGPGLYIGHFGNIVLRKCALGRNCSISQSVHIHPEDTNEKNTAGPIIGDQVWIGAHAQIVGSFRVGSRSTISAGAHVRRDIPEQTLCMGNPARVVMGNYNNNQLLGLDP